MSGISIKCVQCKQDFQFTEQDQNFFKSKGWNKPKRCKRCRNVKKEYYDTKHSLRKVSQNISINDRDKLEQLRQELK